MQPPPSPEIPPPCQSLSPHARGLWLSGESWPAPTPGFLPRNEIVVYLLHRRIQIFNRCRHTNQVQPRLVYFAIMVS